MDIEFSKWIDMAYDYRLKIKDVMNMKKGDTMSVLVLDRNVGDIAVSANPENVVIDPYQFFRYNFATYIHDNGLKGTMIYHWQDKDYGDDEFEFDIEYAPHSWYPLKNGKLPKKDPQGGADFIYTREVSWTEFPIDTGIGWRGPMVRSQYLKYLPPIYASDDEY